ncbi:50S ribosomal protein L1 [Ignicoccus islandicus DSM 13165]|uniref:Large ribosomal subunit protein uL1 n=1 Tax=Ignicoccus islandicus DSM 13165 TaxID=940295 RepID=A0A0U3EB21_9CREN|nr:50S ribosomal protein L1 [Ignicoccus islandicus]ALU11651.1 50S ribosomal protein L1 [Ignicoccus islandicus DSM 13165]
MSAELEWIETAVKDAIEKSPKRNFLESVEMIVVLKDIDLKGPEGRIREVVELPYQPHKDVNICVVADGEMALTAQKLGVNVITREELQNMDKKRAKKLASTCDWVLVKVDLMGLAGKVLGPALGPRGKAPIPVPPNAPLQNLIEKYKKSVNIRIRKQPQVMCRIGTKDMDVKELAENAYAVLQALERKLPNAQHQVSKVIIKTTMGPPFIAVRR